MKNINIVLFIIIICTIVANAQETQTPDLKWYKDFEKAKLEANSQNKNILIYFKGSLRSQSSKALEDDFFNTKKFRTIANNNLILVKVFSQQQTNFSSKKQQISNLELKNRYLQKVFPTVVLTDANGVQLGIIESYNYLHDTSKHFALINKKI